MLGIIDVSSQVVLCCGVAVGDRIGEMSPRTPAFANRQSRMGSLAPDPSMQSHILAFL